MFNCIDVGVASVWCVVAAVSVDAEKAFANGANLFSLSSSGSSDDNGDGWVCEWKHLGISCEVASFSLDDARLLTFEVTASRTSGLEREVLRLLSLASELQLTLLLFVHDKFFFSNNLL